MLIGQIHNFGSGNSFMSAFDIQVPTTVDAFAGANAQNFGPGTKDYVHILVQK